MRVVIVLTELYTYVPTTLSQQTCKHTNEIRDQPALIMQPDMYHNNGYLSYMVFIKQEL